MAIRESYSIEDDNQKFDNVIEAVQAATLKSAQENRKIKVYREVMYTRSETPSRSTLTIVDVPPDITRTMIEEPMTPMRSETLGAFKPCFNCGR